jgi:hypothetical protein
MLRHRPNTEIPAATSAPHSPAELPVATTTAMDDPREHLLGKSPPLSYRSVESSATLPESAVSEMDLSSLSRKTQWITLAVASGACAAFNGVFAKL